MGEMPKNSITVDMVLAGELAAAGAGGRAGHILDGGELGIGDLAAAVRANGLINILDGHVAALIRARGNGAAIEHQAGDVEARQGHNHAGGWSCRRRPAPR